MKKNKLKVKAVISSFLLVFGFLSLLTGAVLFFLEYGMLWIFTRQLIKDVHAVSAVGTGLLALVHFCLNWRVYKGEVRALRGHGPRNLFDNRPEK